MPATYAQRWLALALLTATQFIIVLDVAIVNVALPSIQRRPRLLGAGPAVGLERVRPHLRRLPPARRPCRRPARAPTALHRRRSPLFAAASLGARPRHGRTAPLIGFRAVQGLGAAHRRPGRPVHPDDHLHRGRRAQQGARHLGRRLRPRRRRRRARRRRPDRPRRVGVDLLHQRARRDRRHGAWPRACSARAASTPRRATSTCPARSRRPAGSCCWCTASSAPATTAGPAPARSAPSRAAARPARGLRGDRAAPGEPAPAAAPVPPADRGRRQRGRARARRVDLLDVLLPVAVHAGRAGLVAAAHRRRLPAIAGTIIVRRPSRRPSSPASASARCC